MSGFIAKWVFRHFGAYVISISPSFSLGNTLRLQFTKTDKRENNGKPQIKGSSSLMIAQSAYKKIKAHIQAPTHLDSSCRTKFTPGTNFRSIGQVCQMLRNTVTENTANSHTSGISLEISLGIHHKGPDLSLNSITPLSICEMQPG